MMMDVMYRDQNQPDKLITQEELKREYGKRIADGSIDPDEKTFTQYLLNCMERNVGTLTIVDPEKEKKSKFTFTVRTIYEKTVSIEAVSADDHIRVANDGTALAMVLCGDCVADMEDNGSLTRCECCGDLFTPSRLLVNPKNGEQEICPLCGGSLV